MRDYGKVYSAFWQDQDMRDLSEDGRHMALYLMTCPHGNMLGCFRLPDGYASEDLKWSSERVQKGFDELFHAAFAYRCGSTSLVFIRKYLNWNQFENPNVGKAAVKLFEAMRGVDMMKALVAGALREFQPFFPAHILDAFESDSKPFQNPFELSSKTRTIARAIAKPEPEPKPEPEQTLVDRRDAPLDHDPVPEIFAYWQKCMKSDRSKLDRKRIDKIRAALKLGYTPRQLCEAILGCSRSPWNMGQNDRNTKFNSLGLILRDADHIDKFMELADKEVVGEESIEQRNERIMRDFLAGPGADDLNTIDMEEPDEE